jgi:hypothetical protein
MMRELLLLLLLVLLLVVLQRTLMTGHREALFSGLNEWSSTLQSQVSLAVTTNRVTK